MADKDELAGWVMERVERWKEWRDANYKDRWDDYYRLWRGTWTEADKNRAGERSRIVSPELSQAIETSVAELEEATFIRDRWVDVADDVADENKEDLAQAVNVLLEEFKEYNVADAISECYLNGAIYGTGVGKVVVEKKPYKRIVPGPLPAVGEVQKVCVRVIPICPRNFVIDPVAANIDEATGCAHDFSLPLAEVQRRVSMKIYTSGEGITNYTNSVEDLGSLGEIGTHDALTSMCRIVEYHGLVPSRLISKKEELIDAVGGALAEIRAEPIDAAGSQDETLVEAIVTIVNDSIVVKAVINPFLFGDRSIVAFQYDTVPNRFWGRGIAEKGYNPQKALDAEIRARIDALALSTHPMMGIDSTKIPRGETFSVRPGRSILTTGNPAEALFPIKFPPPDPHTFQQTQELREMIQRATGSYELPANADTSRMAATSMSMIVGSMIKRSRRTLANIERQLLRPLVQKAFHRYMQFDSARFPMQDYKFNVRATMGIMAREFEQGQLVSLLSTVPAESPAFWMLIRGIYSNSNIEDREEMIKFSNTMLQNALNPQPPPPDPKVMLEGEKLKFEQAKHKDVMDLEAVKAMQVDRAYQAEAVRDVGEGRMQTATAMLQAVKAEMEQLRTKTEALDTIADAKLKLVMAEVEKAKVLLEAMKVKSESEKTVATSSTSPEGGTSSKTEKVGTVSPSEVNEIKQSMAPANSPTDTLTPLIQELLDVTKVMAGSKQANSQLDEQALAKIIQATNEQALAPIKDGINKLGKPKPKVKPPKIQRDAQGKVISVGDLPVERDSMGLISGLSEE